MMRLEPSPRRLDLRALTPVYALTLILFAAALVSTVWLPIKPCLLNVTTGVPCFLCGGTRASVSLFQGDWLGALRWNPLVVLGLATGGVLAVLRFGFGQTLRLELSSRTRWALGIGLVLANWTYVIVTQGIG